MSVPITLTSGIRLESDKVECEATSTSSEFKLSSRCPGFPSLADNPEAMARPKSGSEGTHAPAGTHQGPLWTALSLAVRSVALGGVASLAVVVALVAWLVLRSALAVDPVVARERLWLQYGCAVPSLEDAPHLSLPMTPRSPCTRSTGSTNPPTHSSS